MRTGRIISGSMAGLSVDVISSILFPPRKGSLTHKQIMDKGRNYVVKLKSRFDESFDSLAGGFKSTKKYTEGLVKNKAKYVHKIRYKLKNLNQSAEDDNIL